MKQIDIIVKSEMYGSTACAVNVADFKKGKRIFPCGDGMDHILTKDEVLTVSKKLSLV